MRERYKETEGEGEEEKKRKDTFLKVGNGRQTKHERICLLSFLLLFFLIGWNKKRTGSGGGCRALGEKGASLWASPSPGLCWSVEVKRGDRVERTGADCTERPRKEEPGPGAQINAIVAPCTMGPAK